MYYKNCGNQISDDSRYCAVYGADLSNYGNDVKNTDYEASKFWMVLGFFLTWWLVLIVYLLLYKDKPKEANYVIKGWICSLFVSFILLILSNM